MYESSLPGGVAAVVDPHEAMPSELELVAEDSIERAEKEGALALASILEADKRRALDVFDDGELKAVEAALFRKGGKPYVRCLATGKDRPAKPEEIVRQAWIARLLGRYRYPKARVGVEFPITFGRDTSKRADIVIFDADRKTTPYIIIEVKAVRLKDGKDQLKSYCHATGAPIGVWSDGGVKSVYHRRNPNHFIELPDLPDANQTIEDILDQPWSLQTLRDKQAARERHKPLRRIIEEMEDEVLANAGVDVFEEVFKLIFTKLYDELANYQGRSEYLRFRNTNTESDLRRRMDDLFDEAKERWDGVFAAGERIRLSGSHLQVCVSYLEEYPLFNSNLDVIDEAFEYLINKSSKGEKGQYFTPRWVIDMCVKMLNPQENETLIDTACGSAGFTVHGIFKVWRDILDDLNIPASHLFTLEKKPPRCIQYVQDKVFAIDFDEKAVRVARCLNLIAGDGQTNVLHLNTLDYSRWEETAKSDEWRDTYNDGWKKLRKLTADKSGFRKFAFDVLMANPPFAGDIKQSDLLSPYDMAHKANGKQENAVGRDLLFVERNLDFLKPGGRMAVVLPQGRFNNSSDKRLREFIAERCRILAVVGLDGNTFKPHTGTKTSVLFVQKWNDDASAGPLCPRADDYPIFFATQQKPSKASNGDKILATEKRVKWVDVSDLSNPLFVDLPYETFIAEHGEPDAVSTYKVFFPGGVQGVYTRRHLNAEFGSLQQLNARPGHATQRLTEATVYEGLATDTHGHYFVQHDLFNHDGLTGDGIAEAFREFAAAGETLFFLTRPFDKAKYEGLLEGLEVAELRLSEVLRENEKFRVDSLYFSRAALNAERLIGSLPCGYTTFAQTAICFRKGVFDVGAENYVEIGVPFVRISNLHDGLIDDNDIARIPENIHQQESKTALQYGDVVLSKTGYAAASFVNLPECNVSQDTIAVKIKMEWRERLRTPFVVAFLNSRIGNTLMTRQFQGNVQMHLSLPDGEKVKIPLLSNAFQAAVEEAFVSSIHASQQAQSTYAQAETLLLRALSFENWQPPEPASYQSTFSQAWSAGRLDAEHFQPKYAALLEHLESKGAFRLGDKLSEPIKRGISPEYVEEDGDVLVINSKHVGKFQVDVETNRRTTKAVLESRPQEKGEVRRGDVLLNSTGYITIGRCQCLLEDIEAVVDNHVAIIRPNHQVDPVYLACFLNSRPGQMQTERGWTGSSGQIELRRDVVADYLVWDAPAALQTEIRSKVEEAHHARWRAKQLLEAAKRAVEVAIEDGEAAGLAVLKAAQAEREAG